MPNQTAVLGHLQYAGVTLLRSSASFSVVPADVLQGNKSFFSEIIASISDIRFSRDGRYILSRDYMNLKLWDMAMENKPLVTLTVHEELRPRVRQQRALATSMPTQPVNCFADMDVQGYLTERSLDLAERSSDLLERSCMLSWRIVAVMIMQLKQLNIVDRRCSVDDL